MTTPSVTIPATDYRRLLEATQEDAEIRHCDVCGAWLDLDEAEHSDGIVGCAKVIREGGDESTCRSYRATLLEGL